jgi:hypothetical protein
MASASVSPIKATPDEEERSRRPTPASTVPLRDLPVNIYDHFDAVDLVRGALRELEFGRFRLASYLVDTMGRDDRIEGVLTTRVNGLLGLPLEFEAPKPPPKLRKAGDEVPKAEEEIDPLATFLAEMAKYGWAEMADEAALGQILSTGIMLGLGLGEVVWNTDGDLWAPKLKFWHPSFINWIWDTYDENGQGQLGSYWLTTADGIVRVPEDGGGRFFVFAPYGYRRGWMRGRVRALALAWLIRNWGRRDWARQSEKHGIAVVVGNVPISADDESKKAFIGALSNLGRETTLECPDLGPNIGKFGIELVEAEAKTYEGFEHLLQHADTAIAVVLLGQNLTTEVQQGSRAAAQVHDQVRKDFQQSDAVTLSRAVRNFLLKPWALYNWAAEDLTPLPQWQTDPPQDLATTADGYMKAGSALTSFKTAGAPVDTRAFLEEIGVPLLSEEEEAAQKEEAEQKDAEARAQMPAPQPGQPPAPGQPKQFSSRPERIDARGQDYVDDLADHAVFRAEQAMRMHLVHVLHAVHQATDATDLKTRLVSLFPHLDTREMAKLSEQVHVMAELSGRAAIIEEL